MMPKHFTAAVDALSDALRLACAGPYGDAVNAAVELLVDTFASGHKVLVFGNGGSSADAQHICGELVGRFLKERKPLPAMALSANQAVLTAWANDYAYEHVFARQVEAHGRPGDLAWGLSTSGNSKNVVEALSVARAGGVRTIGMTGETGGLVAPYCDVLLAAPSRSTPRIQEIHIVTYHAICGAVEDRLFS
jgi:D-sedoheptulose 7-phosphate isomerase